MSGEGRRPVILIGYMGAGKTTVGRLLARQEQLGFFDTDAMLEEQEGRSIPDIFAADGEECFRDMETELLRRLLEQGFSEAVLSAGGGMPVREENRSLLRKLGVVVYLTASRDTIVERVSGSESRPLLQGEDLAGKVERMLAARGPLYENAADLTVSTDGRSARQIVTEIMAGLEKIVEKK